MTGAGTGIAAADEAALARAAPAAEVLAQLSGSVRHDVALVLGSGWAAAADALGEPVWEAPVAALPGFRTPTAVGHGGTVRSVRRSGLAVLVLLGRVHLYEGYPPATVAHGVRVAAAAGCRVVVLTNAAGALSPDLAVGTPVLVSDHLNLTARSPFGQPPGGDRTGVYSPRLRALARAADPDLPDGVYAGLPGPHFETPAEIRMLRLLGADLVGMSTVLEATAAHAAGAEVLAVSLVSNLAAGISPTPLSADEVIAAGRAALPRLGALLAAVVDRIG